MATLTAAQRQQHIFLDMEGVPWIDETSTKVVEVVRDHLNGFTPDRIHEEHEHLSMAQIYAAITYYYDHKSEIDADIQRRDEFIESVAARALRPSMEELRERARRKRPGEAAS